MTASSRDRTPGDRTRHDGTPRDLREDAHALIAVALRAIDPGRAVADTLADLPEIAPWAGAIALDEAGPTRSGLDRTSGGRTLLVAAGAAAGTMAAGAIAVLGEVTDGVVVMPEATPAPPLPDTVRIHRLAEGLSDDRCRIATESIRRLLGGAGEEDRLLVLLSAGAAELVCDPVDGIALDDVRVTLDLLRRWGWPQGRVDAVRGVLDRFAGGGMARWSAPARPVGLVLPPRPGGDPRLIAASALSPPQATPREVEILLRREGRWDDVPDPVRACLLERRAESARSTPEISLHEVGSGPPLLEAVRVAATERGYSVSSLGTSLEGEARRIGRGVARAAIAVQDGIADVPRPACLVGVGEASMRTLHENPAGPNQEVAVAAALELAGRIGILVASVGTGGVDGLSDAAGGWADGHSVVRAESAGVDLAEALARGESGAALLALGDRLVTGPTGRPDSDLFLALVE